MSVYHHNNFFNNKVENDPQVDIPMQWLPGWEPGNPNVWDNGFEGNYWSDYEDRYPNAKELDGSGIWNTPYFINENNQDNYPLVAPIYLFDAGTWEWTQYNVDIISNSTVSDFSFNPEGALIQFNVEGEDGTTGFCRVTIPKNLLSSNRKWIVLVNGQHVTPVVNETAEYSYIYFTYMHSQKTIEIIGTNAIPEFPPTSILSIFLLATLLAGFVYRHPLKKEKPHSY